MKPRRQSVRRRPRPNRFKRPDAARGQRIRRFFGGLGMLVLTVGLAVTFVLIHDVATQCRSLAAHRITVVGNRHLDEITVMRQAGIHPGINILSVRLGRCRARLLAHPWIAEAAVGRHFPDRIEIRILEQQPLAMVELADNRLLIDAAGRPFKRWQDGDPEEMPIIRGLSYIDLPALSPPETPLLAEALEVLRCWQASVPASAPERPPLVIVADRDAGLALETGSDLGTVVLGSGHYQEKMANLNRLVAEMAKQEAAGWRRIDLTHLQRIVVRPEDRPKEEV
ncbi:MAG: FtsQ-type POTRA domain-containing protein [Desulfobacteraceae bacterium]|nr:FtsQ-type POTRA domain-containing protein [Desulfobacteraceae bacterium]